MSAPRRTVSSIQVAVSRSRSDDWSGSLATGPSPSVPGADHNLGSVRHSNISKCCAAHTQLSIVRFSTNVRNGHAEAFGVKAERALPGRTREGACIVFLQPWIRIQEISLAHFAQHRGQKDIGDGELPARDPCASVEPSLQPVQPPFGDLEPRLAAFVLQAGDVAEPEKTQRRRNGADCGEAPLGDACSSLEVGRDKLAGLLRNVEKNGTGLGNDESIIVDDGGLMKRADLAKGRAVELARGVVEPVDAVGQAGLLQRPLDSKVFRFADPLAENPAKA